jgi:hypothetical protein
MTADGSEYSKIVIDLESWKIMRNDSQIRAVSMTDCSCVYIGENECPDLYYTKIRKARKEHRCGECGRPILKNEKYEKVDAASDGIFYHHKTCEDCFSVARSFFCNGLIHGRLWSDLEYHVRDIGGQVSSDCLVPLTKTAREKVCDLIEELWKLSEER